MLVTLSVNGDDVAARMRRHECLNNANADASAKEYNTVGYVANHPIVWEWVAHGTGPQGGMGRLP